MTKLEILISQADGIGDAPRGRTFHAVFLALTKNLPLDASALYELPYDDFELVIEALREWRLKRYVYGATAFGPLPVSTEDRLAVLS